MSPTAQYLTPLQPAPYKLTNRPQKPCLEDYTSGSEIADCGQFDIECICSNDQFLDGIACCLDEECDEDGKSAAVKFAQQICGTQGVEVPDEVTCSENQQNEDEGDLASGLKVCLAGAAVAMAFAL